VLAIGVLTVGGFTVAVSCVALPFVVQHLFVSLVLSRGLQYPVDGLNKGWKRLEHMQKDYCVPSLRSNAVSE
jgi:hypothetical protein